MPWLTRFPWRFIVRRLARAHGFVDPISVLARLHSFAQPAEVAEPIELLRAGVVFHARGLINARVIQHNLDWVWPYWIERQFDPRDDAFIPRAFSITHINLTHRNWTAIGLPDCEDMPIVDPRGLVTPLFDGWSLDSWVLADDGRRLLPSRIRSATQRLDMGDGLAVTTETNDDGLALCHRAWVEAPSGQPTCCVRMEARSDAAGWLVVALRPYNPEGISFIHKVELASDRRSWSIENNAKVDFSEPADRHHCSDYRAGAVSVHLHDRDEQTASVCDVGMATAAAMFRLDAGVPRQVTTRFALSRAASRVTWQDALGGHCRLCVPDERLQYLYDASLRTLVLHAPSDIYAGPYTYKRFWFRDAALIAHGLLCAGLTGRAERALDRFAPRQTRGGYFHSQAGEWDANGEVLWILHRFCELTGRPPKVAWHRAIERGGKWIVRKRLADNGNLPHSGLLPPGFSAEHLGPNDYYYWDDFWGIGGLRAAADLCRLIGKSGTGDSFQHEAEMFQLAVDRSLIKASEGLGRQAMPASPYRRLDAGAIGSLAAGYPLQLFQPSDARLLDTVGFLQESCFVDGGFFQDMIHSGINPYLTLHVAQILLRAGDRHSLDIMDTVAALASPTGQWPEAVHPRTRGGCMGDGQHVWAAAEWFMMVRNCFVREEADGLILGAGLRREWFEDETAVTFGPAPTRFGPITLTMEKTRAGPGDFIRISWQGDWHDRAPPIEVRAPGHAPVVAAAGQSEIMLQLDGPA
ncbi:MAG: hypothetical protein ACTSWM_03415 [Alphaproteobacteria bacterium]